jgi:hypothetical protein
MILLIRDDIFSLIMLSIIPGMGVSENSQLRDISRRRNLQRQPIYTISCDSRCQFEKIILCSLLSYM